MDDPLRVGNVQRIGNLNPHTEQFVRLKRLASDAMLEGLTFEQFHHDKRLPLVFIDVVNGAYVGMIQRRGSAGFALEALQDLMVLG